MREYVVTYTVTTNVASDEGGFNGLDAIREGAGYGLGDLIAKGEYNLVDVAVTAVPPSDDEEG